jgi:hypothetical protein
MLKTCYLGHQIKNNDMGGACGSWERRGTCGGLVGKPEGRKLLERPRRRWGILLKGIFKKWDGGMD